MVNEAQAEKKNGANPVILIAMLVVGLALGLALLLPKPAPKQDAPLTQEGRAYLASMPLEDIEWTMAESFGGGRLIEMKGKVTNTGARKVKRVEVFVIFRDYANEVCLKERLAIVKDGLKQGEAKPFRLPFDTVPERWNQQQPNLVIASVEFQP